MVAGGGSFRKRKGPGAAGAHDDEAATGAGGGSSGGRGLLSSLALSKRQRRSLLQAGALLLFLLGCALAIQLLTAASSAAANADADAADGPSSLAALARRLLGGGLRLAPAWRLPLPLPPPTAAVTADRSWALATNVQTLRSPSANDPAWDAVDAIHRLLAATEYGRHNTDCERLLVYTQQHPAGLGAQMNQMLTALMVAVQERRAFLVDPGFLGAYTCRAEGEPQGYASCFETDVVIGPPACQAKWTGPNGRLRRRRRSERSLGDGDGNENEGKEAGESSHSEEEEEGGDGDDFWSRAGALPAWRGNDPTILATPVVQYTAAFLPSTEFHASRPWNAGKGIAAWGYPLPLPEATATVAAAGAAAPPQAAAPGGEKGEENEGEEEKGKEPTEPAFFTFAAWKSYAAARLWKPRPEVAAAIDRILTTRLASSSSSSLKEGGDDTTPTTTDNQKKQQQQEEGGKAAAAAATQRPQLARPVCALHVRRGDKRAEATFEPIEKYMALLVNATTAEAPTSTEGGGGGNKGGCRTIFVATDDQPGTLPQVQALAATAFPQATVVWIDSEHERSGHSQGAHDTAGPQQRATATLELLAELTVLGRADVLVGAASSNVVKLALSLRGAEGKALGTAWSVDGGAVTAEGWELP